MFGFGPVRAVIVDDTPSDLFCIGTAFAAASIPCTPYWYDVSELNPKDKLKPKPSENGHEFLRVIFTDLNLEENKLGHLPDIINPVINTIEQLVSKEGGPYAVIFWTIMTHTIDDIRAELIPRLKASDIVLPVAIDEIKKGPFLTYPSEDHSGKEVLELLFTNTFNNTNNLRDEVKNVLSKYGILLMLSEWESRAMCAAGRSTNSLFNVANLENEVGEDITDTIKKITALVAKEAAGHRSASEMPAKAYDAAMQDILIDSFNQSVNDAGYSKIVRDELQDIITSGITINSKEKVYAKLNKIFHIETEIEGFSFTNRGSVIDLTEAIDKKIIQDADTLCHESDYFWEPERIKIPTAPLKIDEDQKASISTILENGEKSARQSHGPFNIAVGEHNTSVREQIKQGERELITSKTDFYKSLRWVLIEIGADCDHAQDKARTLRFLSAVIVPSEFIENFVYGGDNKKLKNDALRILGPYDMDSKIYYILISLKRFVVWQVPNTLPEIVVIYRLRKNIIDFLLNHYATWSMRPGITEYKFINTS